MRIKPVLADIFWYYHQTLNGVFILAYIVGTYFYIASETSPDLVVAQNIILTILAILFGTILFFIYWLPLLLLQLFIKYIYPLIVIFVLAGNDIVRDWYLYLTLFGVINIFTSIYVNIYRDISKSKNTDLIQIIKRC